MGGVLLPPPMPLSGSLPLVSSTLNSTLPHQEVSASETSAGSDRKEGWKRSEAERGDYLMYRDGAEVRRDGNACICSQRQQSRCYSANTTFG